MKLQIIWIVLALASLLFSQDREICLACHSDEEFVKIVDDSIEVSLYVDIEKYEKSIHADLECTDCHASISDPEEHDPELPDVNCGTCHEDAKAEYDGSLHATSLARQSVVPATCVDCHGKHDMLPADNRESKIHKLNIEYTCGNCHSRPEVIEVLGLKGDGPVSGYDNSIHNKILRGEPENGAPSCISCHGYHGIYLMSDPRSTFNKLNRSETCGQCHAHEKERYEKSVHWRAVQRGHFESPTCNDCHGEHGIESPMDLGAMTNKLNLSTQICAKCHSSPTMMKRFGLNPEQFSSYQKTYHGLAQLKGSSDAANCTSCHEVHAIMEQSAPESSVHPDNLAKTCGRCHDNISAEFIGIAVHPTDLESRNPTAFYIRIIYIILIVGVVGGMFVHNVIILSYYVRKKRIALRSHRTFPRFLPFEVYQHMLLILSFFTLVVTGFALKFPDALWVEWLVSAGMTELVRSVAHRVAAVVMIVISFIQMGYFIFHKRGRNEIVGLMPKVSDVTGFWQNMRFYLYKTKQRPKFDRWDYTEKAEYLALIWGTAVMAITGFVLWYPEIFIKFMPSWMFEVSEIIHYFEAWLATLSIIVWHWFLVIYHPEKYPMSLTWMNGRITEEELKHHHPLEYEKEKNNLTEPKAATKA